MACFPRSNERGSIEAPPGSVQTFSVATAFRVQTNAAPLKHVPIDPEDDTKGTFPRSNERGSIEAFGHALSRRITSTFPRSNERGSIEARLKS